MNLPAQFYTIFNIPIDTEQILNTHIDKKDYTLTILFENRKSMLMFQFDSLAEARAADLMLRTYMNDLMLDKSGFAKTLADLIDLHSSKGNTRH